MILVKHNVPVDIHLHNPGHLGTYTISRICHHTKEAKWQGKVTVSHGPLTNLNMPAMTMVFRVKDAAWLDQMQVGAKIRFVADAINGALTIVQLEAGK